MNLFKKIKWEFRRATAPLRHSFERAERLYWEAKNFSYENNYPEKDGFKKLLNTDWAYLSGKMPLLHALKSEQNYSESVVAIRESIRRDLGIALPTISFKNLRDRNFNFD